MSEENNYDYKAIDAVVNIWTREALSQRPDWGDDFFVGKMNAKDSLMTGLSLDEMLERMETAGIDKAFLIAAHAGRVGMPGCYHMPYEIVARACEEYPDIPHKPLQQFHKACDNNPAYRLFLHEQQSEMLYQCQQFPSAQAFHQVTIPSSESPLHSFFLQRNHRPNRVFARGLLSSKYSPPHRWLCNHNYFLHSC